MYDIGRNCPKCNKELTYARKGGYNQAVRTNSVCSSCGHTGKMNISEKIFSRNCPECSNVILHTTGHRRDTAVNEDWLCRKCSNLGREFSEEHRKNIGLSKLGENNPWFGKKRPEYSKLRMGHFVSDETRQKLSEANTGYKHTEEAKKKMRLSAIKRIENTFGQLIPNYNPEACKIIDEYGEQHGYNFQHAENGGEICIDGYFPDGLDESKKTIIEVDEKHHFIGSELRMKDVKRQEYLENLGYEVIRVGA